MSSSGFIGAGEVVGKMAEQLELLAVAKDISQCPSSQFTFHPESLLQIVGMLQLACRHEQLPASSYRTARHVISAARMSFAEFPRLVRLIDAGDNPAADTDPSDA